MNRGVFALVVGLMSSACGEYLVAPPPPPEVSHAVPRWANVGKACFDDVPAVPIPDSKRVPYSRGSDNDWAQIARTVPGGFGGFYLDQGVGVVILVDTTQRVAALAALQAKGFPAAGARVRKGRWNFAQLFDWMGYIEQSGALTSSVTFDDVDEVENRLTFGLADTAAFAQFESRLSGLDLPCRLVFLTIQAPAVIR